MSEYETNTNVLVGALVMAYLLSRTGDNGGGDDPPSDGSVEAAFDYTPRDNALDVDGSPSTGAESYEWHIDSENAVNWSAMTATGREVTFEPLPAGGTSIVNGEIEYHPADYIVTLTVTGANGETSTVSETITVPT